MPEADSPVMCRGVRGAITASENTREAILEATEELLREMVRANGLRPGELASAIFTTTSDLDAVYPAKAARVMGWTQVPLMCAHEMAVPGSLARCIRVLLHWNTRLSADEIRHVYLREARVLRPDLAAGEPSLGAARGDQQ